MGLVLLAVPAYWLFARTWWNDLPATAASAFAPWPLVVSALAGMLVVRLVPTASPSAIVVPAIGPDAGPDAGPGGRGSGGGPARDAIALQAKVLACGVIVFALGVLAVGDGALFNTAGKPILLLGLPLAMFWMLRRSGAETDLPLAPARGRGLLVPALSLAAWAVGFVVMLPTTPGLGQFSALLFLAPPFVLNAVLEELCYRRWLQTRCELLFGRWPAIAVSSLSWSAAQVLILAHGPESAQDARFWTLLLAGFGVHALQGVLLGYLWSKYRSLWPVVALNSALNAAVIALLFAAPGALSG